MNRYFLLAVTLTVLLFPLKSCPPKEIRKPIKLSRNQLLVLKGAETTLRTHRNELTAHLVELEKGPFEAARDYLRTGMHQARMTLSNTKIYFERYSTNAAFRDASRGFFRSLDIQYSQVDELLINIEKDEYPAVRNRGFTLLDYNLRAYETLEESQLLTFNLAITTGPQQGASIFYWRVGEDEQSSTNPTNTTLMNLGYAKWFIRVELPGYHSQQKEHDPFTDPNHVLHFDLKPK